jgi:hypothetical protein
MAARHVGGHERQLVVLHHTEKRYVVDFGREHSGNMTSNTVTVLSHAAFIVLRRVGICLLPSMAGEVTVAFVVVYCS